LNRRRSRRCDALDSRVANTLLTHEFRSIGAAAQRAGVPEAHRIVAMLCAAIDPQTADYSAEAEGNPAVTSVFKAMAAHGDPSIREAVADLLHFVEQPDAVAAVLTLLRGEKREGERHCKLCSREIKRAKTGRPPMYCDGCKGKRHNRNRTPLDAQGIDLDARSFLGNPA
jgi:hypothetical protein